MAFVCVTNIQIESDVQQLTEQFKFMVNFDCLNSITGTLKWEAVYLGDPTSSAGDQILDTLPMTQQELGPKEFNWVVPSPDYSKIANQQDLFDTTALMIKAYYNDQQFFCCSFLVSHEYQSKALIDNPPQQINWNDLVRRVKADKPIVNIKDIDWNNQQICCEQKQLELSTFKNLIMNFLNQSELSNTNKKKFISLPSIVTEQSNDSYQEETQKKLLCLKICQKLKKLNGKKKFYCANHEDVLATHQDSNKKISLCQNCAFIYTVNESKEVKKLLGESQKKKKTKLKKLYSKMKEVQKQVKKNQQVILGIQNSLRRKFQISLKKAEKFKKFMYEQIDQFLDKFKISLEQSDDLQRKYLQNQAQKNEQIQQKLDTFVMDLENNYHKIIFNIEMKPFKDIVQKYNKYTNDAKRSIVDYEQDIICENIKFFFEKVQKDSIKFWNNIDKLMIKNLSEKNFQNSTTQFAISSKQTCLSPFFNEELDKSKFMNQDLPPKKSFPKKFSLDITQHHKFQKNAQNTVDIFETSNHNKSFSSSNSNPQQIQNFQPSLNKNNKVQNHFFPICQKSFKRALIKEYDIINMSNNIYKRTSLNDIFNSQEINPSSIRKQPFPEEYNQTTLVNRSSSKNLMKKISKDLNSKVLAKSQTQFKKKFSNLTKKRKTKCNQNQKLNKRQKLN